MSTTLEAPQAPTLAAAPPPPQENLAKYDSRRALARAVDGLFVGAPFLIPVLGLGFTLSVALVAVSLLYFFLCEALWGQTLGKRLLGLRVLTRDGAPASAKAVALRTSTRIVEDGPIGLAVFLASGKRRARLGDLLGDTIVASPAPGLPRAGFSPLLIAVPAGIAVAAVAVVLGFSGHFARQDYLHAVNKACAHNSAAAPARDLDAIVARQVAAHRELAAVETPGSARKLRAEILALDASVTRAVEAAGRGGKPSQGDIAQVRAARQRAAKRYAQLGMRACAGV
jgi:uncharacterized RDD family membrane protein YckC